VHRKFARILLFCQGFIVTTKKHEIEDVDYSKWLGPNWRENKFKGKRVSMTISNHESHMDGPVLCMDTSNNYCTPAWTPADMVGDMALGKFPLVACQSVFIERASDEAGRERSVKQVEER
jgi:hypothetical protein